MVPKNNSDSSKKLAGKVGLAEAIQALREELTQAISQAPGRGVRFGLGSIELTVEAAVTTNIGGNAGVKWWLIEAGGEVSRESVSTQSLHLTLDPVLVRENPITHKLEVTDVLVTDTEESDLAPNPDEHEAPLQDFE